MAIQIKDLPVYKASRDALVGALSLAERAFTDAEFSYESQSDYRRALSVIDATLSQFRPLAVSMLKSIDEAIAKDALVVDLTKSAQKAKREADRLNQAAHKIEEIAGIVDKITDVVATIGKLPFL